MAVPGCEVGEPDLFAQSLVLTGNVAKVKVIRELQRLLSTIPGLHALDVGCVGLRPLELWEPLLLRYPFHLTAVDVSSIQGVEELVRSRGWQDSVTAHRLSVYRLTEQFPPESFDIVVATQVLQYVARLGRAVQQMSTVLRPGGDAFFTVDSAHWKPRFDLRYPVRLLKNIARKGLSLVNDERYYNLPWFDHEITAACKAARLNVIDVGYYNLHPLKFLHNELVRVERQNRIMRQWFELEESLNEEPAVQTARHCFLGIYVHARKPQQLLSGQNGDLT